MRKLLQKLLGLQWNMFVNWWCMPWFLLYWVTLFSASLEPMWVPMRQAAELDEQLQDLARISYEAQPSWQVQFWGLTPRWTASRTRSNLTWSPTFLVSTILGIDTDIHTLETCRAWAWRVWLLEQAAIESSSLRRTFWRTFCDVFLWVACLPKCKELVEVFRLVKDYSQKKLRRQKVARVSVPLLRCINLFLTDDKQ